MRDVVIGLASGLVGSIIAVIITLNQLSKSDGNFQGKTSAEIGALQKQVQNISEKVDSLHDRSNGLDALVSTTKIELGRSVEEARQKLNKDIVAIKKTLSEHSKALETQLNDVADKKFNEINALNIPERTVLSYETFSEGQQRYLFERQMLIRLVSVDSNKEQTTFELMYPDGQEKMLSALSRGERAHFEFQGYKFILDVNNVTIVDHVDKKFKSSTISINRSI
ncbi:MULTISPECIES: hypothetical protein [Idiomarina]|jgi:hypothetical protein|uniref:hypothetical protein n=1 Tax=Idiomarina TaxID=135575 RepID=UPI000C5C11BD|nr:MULTISPECIES: hypothetical protein [Idiomarina]MBP59525.1 hypothetical protein [Idiomarina sp.]|tara:strand:+ start:9546 stop:10217 length:672 start_codon:yes stop_codon:yes gene_type:complete